MHIPTTFTFRLTARTKRGASAFISIRVIASEQPRNSSVEFLFTFSWTDDSFPPQTIVLKTVMDKLAAYLNATASTLRYVYYYTDGVGYSASLTNCTLPENSCNHPGIDRIKAKLFNNMGTLPAFTAAMDPETYISYVQVSLKGACQKLTRPKVLKQYPVVNLSPCSYVRKTLPYRVFYDEEDGYNLQLSIFKINGIATNVASQWISVNSGENFLYGIITEEIVSKQPHGGYNLTIRARDSSQLYVDTHMMVRIYTVPLHQYYLFNLHMTLKPATFLYDFFEQYNILHMTNTYFKSNFTNILSFKKLSGSNFFTVTSSICTLGQRCDNVAANKLFSQMVLSGSTPLSAFANSFQTRYVVRAVTTYTDPICQQPLNPPVPAINPWTVSATLCGAMRVSIPHYLFTDKEDGDTRNLKLQLFTNEQKPLPISSWLQLNSTSKVRYY